MKAFIRLIGSFVFLGLLIPSVGYAQDGFKGFKVEVYTVYPEVKSYLTLEGPDAVRPDPNLNPDDYCPRPPVTVPCCGQPKIFQFQGCKQGTANTSASLKPNVIYSLFDPKKGIDRLLTCRFDYSFDSTSNTCSAKPIPLNETNIAHCTASASYANGVCEVTIVFQP